MTFICIYGVWCAPLYNGLGNTDTVAVDIKTLLNSEQKKYIAQLDQFPSLFSTLLSNFY